MTGAEEMVADITGVRDMENAIDKKEVTVLPLLRVCREGGSR